MTLSTEQLAWGQARLQRQGVARGCRAAADLRLQDYRDIGDAPFDAICSIEMVEAVGQAYWPQHFPCRAPPAQERWARLHQSIVIRDDLFDRYVRSTDFIQQYIFPGGCLPSGAAFREQAQAAGLRVGTELAFGRDYATPCTSGARLPRPPRAEVLAQGFDERFCRIWDFYLAYCEAAFLSRRHRRGAVHAASLNAMKDSCIASNCGASGLFCLQSRA